MMFKKYRRTNIAEMRPYVKGEDLSGISVSKEDNPEEDMGMVARNPDNHNDQWYVARAYFKKNFAPLYETDESPDEPCKPENDRVSISRDAYDGLRESGLELEALKQAGVDNWEGYSYAMELLEEMRPAEASNGSEINEYLAKVAISMVGKGYIDYDDIWYSDPLYNNTDEERELCMEYVQEIIDDGMTNFKQRCGLGS